MTEPNTKNTIFATPQDFGSEVIAELTLERQTRKIKIEIQGECLVNFIDSIEMLREMNQAIETIYDGYIKKHGL